MIDTIFQRMLYFTWERWPGSTIGRQMAEPTTSSLSNLDDIWHHQRTDTTPCHGVPLHHGIVCLPKAAINNLICFFLFLPLFSQNSFLSLEIWFSVFLIILVVNCDIRKPNKNKYSTLKLCPRSFWIFARKPVSWVAFTMLLDCNLYLSTLSLLWTYK